jgi:hypothetical protein
VIKGLLKSQRAGVVFVLLPEVFGVAAELVSLDKLFVAVLPVVLPAFP